MPGTNGLEAIAEIKKRAPDIRILVVTMHKTDEYIQEALRTGASGYILKESSHDELRTAIRTVLSGKVYLSPDVSERVVSGFLSGGTSKPVVAASAWDTLTIREREVLKLVAEGHGNKHIADYLCLSIKTVEKHRSSLMRKLGLRNASMLTAYAIEKGIVTL
jgi:DNA-binding NarL/FixJ family response regulator